CTSADNTISADRLSHISTAPSTHTLSLHDALPICAAIVVVYLILVRVLAVMPALLIPGLLDSLDSLQDVFSNLIANLQATSVPLDRKSTRLNSSHVKISYAVFSLKKKSSPREPRSF